jgi:hypothetical protein
MERILAEAKGAGLAVSSRSECTSESATFEFLADVGRQALFR